MSGRPYEQFIAVDWSGAKGSRHRNVAIAVCAPGGDAPRLVRPGEPWSRQGVLEWLKQQPRSLVGFDFSFAPPWVDRRGYFRFGETPANAFAFWRYVDSLAADDADWGASSFVERGPHRTEFYLGKADGEKAPYMRLRRCEQVFNARGGGKPSSVFDAIGAAQVCKASFAGMRLLHHARGALSIWPFENVRSNCSTIVEIYTRLFIQHAGLRGQKVRTRALLNQALGALQSAPFRGSLGNSKVSDHATDALIAAAGLRTMAPERGFWAPPELTPAVRKTEGWTFGVR